MQADLKGWTTVLAGAWNPAIIRPNWLAKHVLGKAEGEETPVEVRLAIDFDERRLYRFTTEGFGLTVERGRITVSPLVYSRDSLVAADRVAVRILRCLPHTPLEAVGLNYWFTNEAPIETLAPTFRVELPPEFGALELRARALTVERKFTGIDGAERPLLGLMFLSDLDDGSVAVRMNYHFAEKSCEAAATWLEGARLRYLPHAVGLLQKYGVECAQPEGM